MPDVKTKQKGKGTNITSAQDLQSVFDQVKQNPLVYKHGLWVNRFVQGNPPATTQLPDSGKRVQVISPAGQFPDITGQGVSAQDFLRGYQDWIGSVVGSGAISAQQGQQTFENVRSAVYLWASSLTGLTQTNPMLYGYQNPDLTAVPFDMLNQQVLQPMGIDQNQVYAAIAPKVFANNAASTIKQTPEMTQTQWDSAYVTAMAKATTDAQQYQFNVMKDISSEYNTHTDQQAVIDNLATHYHLNDSNQLPTPGELKQAYEMSASLVNKGYPELLSSDNYDRLRQAMQQSAQTEGAKNMAASDFERGILQQLGFDSNNMDSIQDATSQPAGQQTLTPDSTVLDQTVAGAAQTGGNYYKQTFLSNKLNDAMSGFDEQSRQNWLNAINAPAPASTDEQLAQLQKERDRWAGLNIWQGTYTPSGQLSYLAGIAPDMVSQIDQKISDLKTNGVPAQGTIGQDPLEGYLQNASNSWLVDYYNQAPNRRGLSSGPFAPITQWK